MFQFDQYDIDELRSAGGAFVEAFTSSDRRRRMTPKTLRKARTAYVFDWFTQARAARTFCSAHHAAAEVEDAESPGRVRAAREHLLDLVHAEPAVGVADRLGRREYYHARLRLGLECEWGYPSSPAANEAEVARDAYKLAHVRADAKVFVFSGRRRNEAKEVLRLLEAVRETSVDAAPWLAVWVDGTGAAYSELLS